MTCDNHSHFRRCRRETLGTRLLRTALCSKRATRRSSVCQRSSAILRVRRAAHGKHISTCRSTEFSGSARQLDLSCFTYLAYLIHWELSDSDFDVSSSWTAFLLSTELRIRRSSGASSDAPRTTVSMGLEFGTRDQSEPEWELFEEAARFGIRSGFTLPIPAIIKHARHLRLIAASFHAHARCFRTSDRFVGGSCTAPSRVRMSGMALTR